MVSGHEHFSIPSEDVKDIENILREESEKRNKSKFIVDAIREKYQRQNYKLIDDFQTPNLELDFLPRINEPLTKEQLKQLSSKDVSNLLKMIYYNKKLVEEHFDSIHRWNEIKKELKI